ncbi:DUF2487 family protein [Paenibacillus sp. NPDC056933]|uniref:DUF2487 family protein n=1 Tax=Paenibacillus sp. NPDC056933 TaxID=3345968 RepID=UPI0036411198
MGIKWIERGIRELKFSEMTQDSWAELQLYLDTCLIPYTALNGERSPVEATEALERLRDFLDMVEIPFKGRIMTYPAFHYTYPEMSMALNTLCEQLKSSGFKYVVVMSSDGVLEKAEIPSADLVLSRSILTQEVGEDEIARFVGEKIRELWKR